MLVLVRTADVRLVQDMLLFQVISGYIRLFRLRLVTTGYVMLYQVTSG
jgi:hypothetical protein